MNRPYSQNDLMAKSYTEKQPSKSPQKTDWMAREKNLLQQRLKTALNNAALACLASLCISSLTWAAAPTVSLATPLLQSTQAAPANGAFVAPAGISLAATANAETGSSIAKVEFYQGTALIGTATAPTVANGNSYSINWSNVSANSYSVTARATDSKNEAASTAPITVNVINNSAPVVSLTASPSNAVAPATIILNATATDSDGTITQVEFLNGSSSIATVTQAPYTTNWANVAQGNYSITARATDNLGTSTTSTPVPVTVAASAPKIYDIHTDQIDTPRLITDQNGNTVWRWDSAPFGETLPNEQPTQATARFVFDLRFPGQQYDAETGLHYNYFRDYDPQAGRYVESDPIGLGGGINTYGYVSGRPAEYTDPFGLCATCIGMGGASYPGTIPNINLPNINFGPYVRPVTQVVTQIVTKSGPVVGAGAAGYMVGTLINQYAGRWIADKIDSISDLMAGPKQSGVTVPNVGPPGQWIDGDRRSRLYGPDGRPVLDIDKPHQGYQRPHVHEWPDGVREHPGRDVCPLDSKPEDNSNEGKQGGNSNEGK